MLKQVFIFLLCTLLTHNVLSEVGTRDYNGKLIDFNKYIFTDENNERVPISQYFKVKKPVYLVPVYYDCGGVCTFTLNQLFSDLKKIKFNPGKAIEIVVFSINPNETPELALSKKKSYLKKYNYENYSDGFHFLVGDQAQIAALTNELGFLYEKNNQEYAHPSATYLMTGEGRISKVLNGRQASLKKMHDDVFRAAHGRKLSSFEKMVYSCNQKENKK